MAAVFIVLLIVGLLAYAHQRLVSHPFKLLEVLLREFKQLFARQQTTGSVNAVGLIVVAVVGILILIENAIGHLVTVATAIMGPEKGHEYIQTVSSLTLFLVLALMALVSVLFTLLREIRG